MTATQPYIPVARRPLDLEDYINVARRHSTWIFGPLYIGTVISIVVACSLQNVYTAQASMQIKPSQISENLVQSTINERLTERIEQMKSVVTSRQTLATLLQDPTLNLYKDDIAKMPLDDVEDEMRSKININISPESITTKRGVSVFYIQFSYPRRKEAQATVAKLVTQFINISKSTEREQQNTLTNFFGDELSQAKADLEKKNDALTAFRKNHPGELPEQEGMNEAAMTSLQNQVNSINGELARLQNDKVNIETNITYLKSELGMTDLLADDAPPPMTSPVFRQNEELAQLNRQIENDEFTLQQLRQTYRETYPDIRNLETRIDLLKKKRDDIAAQQEKERQAEAAKAPTEQKKPTNVKAAISRNQIEGDIEKAKALLLNNQHDQDYRRKQIENLTREIESYRSKLAATSVLEAEYADLKRDALVATDKYEKLQHNQDLAHENAELVSRGATEDLELLDAPTVPQNPTSPNRPMIVGAGIGISLLLGLALAGIQEARDASLKNLKDVRAYTNLPVLCSIPLLENTLLVKRKRRIMYLAWSAAVIVGILAVGAAAFYYSQVIKVT